MGPARAPFKATRAASTSRAEPLVPRMLLREHTQERQTVGPEFGNYVQVLHRSCSDHACRGCMYVYVRPACMGSDVDCVHMIHADKVDTTALTCIRASRQSQSIGRLLGC